MKLYVVRHGETDWNKKGMLQGDTDIPLNDNGRSQALKVKEKLKNKKVDLCFTSPLMRARETASIITESNVPINISSLLIERDFGMFEGTNFDNKETEIKYWNYKLNLNDNEVESVQELFKRVAFFLKFIDEIYDDANILIVSHGSTIRALNYLITGFLETENLLEFNVKNGYIYEYDL